MMRSIWSVVVGIIFIIGVTTLVDIALHLAKVYPPADEPMSDALAALATTYRIIIGIIGAYLTAWLAPSKPMKHALILGCLGVLLGLAGLAMTWGKGLGPVWYPIALVILAIPQCWVGGRLYQLVSTRNQRSAEAV